MTPENQKTAVPAGEGAVEQGKRSLPIMGDGVLPSRRQSLAQHVPMATKELIWGDKCINMFSLLTDNREFEYAKSQKEWMHPGEWRAKMAEFRVEESIMNWVRAFSVFVAIVAEKSPELLADLACYQSRITSFHEKYRGDVWRGYDTTFRKEKEFNNTLTWDRLDTVAWHAQFTPDIGGAGVGHLV